MHRKSESYRQANWKWTVEGTRVTFSYLSVDGEEGYPGDVLANVSYLVTEDGTLSVDFLATATRKTVVNLTNHSYFNLAGHQTGVAELYNHRMHVRWVEESSESGWSSSPMDARDSGRVASALPSSWEGIGYLMEKRITETDQNSIPTGGFIKVGGTAYDLRIETRLGDAMGRVSAGYDDNFCVSNYGNKSLAFVARAFHPPSGRYMELHSDQPGVQFYTSNFLPAPADPALVGKGGVGYRRHGAFCLETQNYPDAVNRPHFPDVVLKPGDTYVHRIRYSFGAVKEESSPSVVST
ncbi:Aldose 1-epimerase [Eumeta japonica]|uniref:Galactose mutarotase n=1 Tax=Eumeta variegata TaxID=151549 RepID=A0A4C1TJS0_EUMVA|nr:Aldose 1-epimerase [Eumeta japonica]